MEENKVHRLFIILLLGCFLINLGQAIFTGIHYDEVYYAIWGKNLDFGYFDHPPAVAMLTYLGSLFFEGNLSIRFFTVVLHLCSLSLIWLTIDEKYRQTQQSVWAFFIVVVSLPMFSVYGFTTTPDVPLIFFASLFLFSYRKFLEQNSWFFTFLLAVGIAGMMYSKYHAVLFVGLVVLSNLRLLLNIKFWVAGVLALVFLLPHFLWQYQSHFASFKFHLISRSLGFDIEYVLEYFPTQMGVFNPFVFGVVAFVLWKNRPKTDFEKTLYFLIIGVIGFFFLMTFKGKAEAHWATIASIPMIVLLVEKVMQQEKVKKYVFKYVVGSLVLIVIARGLLLLDFSKIAGYEDRERLYRTMEAASGGLPVVFNSSFQDASIYEYYTKKPSTTVSSLENRQTQYDFWQNEQKMLGKPVFVILEKGMKGLDKVEDSKKIEIGDFDFVGFKAEDWQVSNRLQIRYDLMKTELKKGEVLEIPMEIENPTAHSVDFKHKEFPLHIKVVFLILKRNYEIEDAQFSVPLGKIESGQKIKGKLKFRVPENLKDREYKFSVVIESFFGHTLNSSFEKVEIK